MKIANTSYSDLLSKISSKVLLLQYTEDSTNYYLFATEANVSWETVLLKGSDDATDFENNHKSTANQPLEIKSAAGRPTRVSASPQPANTVEHWKGYQITIPAGQTSAYVDISFSGIVYIKGGYIVSSDVDLDDYITADVLVAANSSEYIPGIINNAYMIPNQPVIFESAESMMLPTSLKIRVTLTTASADISDTHANVLVDYFA